MNIKILEANSIYIIIGLSIFCLLLLILCIISLAKLSKLNKRFNRFMQPKSEKHNVEAMLIDYLEQVKQMSSRHEEIMNSINDIYSRVKLCTQKVGIIRYNPFDDVGGDLSFAVAVLDENDNGIVLNSIYSREGCYVYGKPIDNGKCDKYKLSKEEEEALKEARKRN